MNIEIVSLRTLATTRVARARITAPTAGARLWVEVTFTPKRTDVWTEAYERILELLDPA